MSDCCGLESSESFVLGELSRIFDGDGPQFQMLSKAERMRVRILLRGGVLPYDFELGVDRWGEVGRVRSAFGFICTVALNSAAEREAALSEADQV